MRRFLFTSFLFLSFAVGCDEAPLLTDTNPDTLNAPVTFAYIPGTNLGVIANANVNLDDVEGTLVAVDLDTRTILTDTEVPLRNFSGQIGVDGARQLLLIADRGDQALLVYSYSIPGAGGSPISFKQVEVTNPALRTTNGIRTDEEPYGVFLANGTGLGDVAYTSNSFDGTMSAILLDDLIPVDLQPEDGELNGLPLISSANFQQEGSGNPPGRGANQIVPSPTTGLLFITSTFTNNLFVVNPMTQAIEAMLDLSEFATTGGMRGLALANDQRAYLAHRGLGGVVVMDVSNVFEDGIDYNVVDAQLIDVISTGRGTEGVTLSTDQKRLFVSNLSDNRVTMIDVDALKVIRQINVTGQSPGQLILDSTRGVIYVLNFLSNNIDVLDETTGLLLGTIK